MTLPELEEFISHKLLNSDNYNSAVVFPDKQSLISFMESVHESINSSNSILIESGKRIIRSNQKELCIGSNQKEFHIGSNLNINSNLTCFVFGKNMNSSCSKNYHLICFVDCTSMKGFDDLLIAAFGALYLRDGMLLFIST